MNENYIHFIGIGGVSMSALAKICLNKGCKVSGSDVHENDEVKELKKLGATIWVGHDASHIIDQDLVIYTGAIPETNAERKRANDLQIKSMERSEFLGILLSKYKKTIAVAGTHGKTTTTAMIGWIMENAKVNPTVHIGGECCNFNSNVKMGEDGCFITEACEYRNSIQYLKPTIAVITSIERDHMDCYQDFEHLKQAFYHFASHAQYVISSESIPLKKSQHKILCLMGEDEKDLTCEAEIIYQITYLEHRGNGYHFGVQKNGEFYGCFYLPIIGEYNVKNALYAIAVCDTYSLSYLDIYDGLSTFLGVKRRMELIGDVNDKILIADYAHHPTEIKNALLALKKRYKKTLICFQPHTYSRTKTLLNEFKSCFKDSAYVCILPTYPARESYDPDGDASILFRNIRKKNKRFITSFQDIPKEWIVDVSCIGIIGAGNIYELAKEWILCQNCKK